MDADQLRPQAYANDYCATRWPILLVHGLAFRQAQRLAYWGRIPQTLREHGAQVFISNQDAWGRFDSNAGQLKDELLQYLDQHNVEKVNIIAHSKGGLDSRVLATLPGMAERIASITTVSTPHRGLKLLNWLGSAPEKLKRVISTPLDILLIIIGDDHPSFSQVLDDLSEQSMRKFNQAFPSPADRLLQSYSLTLRRIYNYPAYIFSSSVLKATDGDNDGVVPLWSTEFAAYRGIVNAAGHAGLSHGDITNRHFAEVFARVIGIPYTHWRPFSRDGFDVLGWWMDLAASLKQQGY